MGLGININIFIKVFENAYAISSKSFLLPSLIILISIIITVIGLLQWLSGKESTCSSGDTGDAGSIPGLGRFPGVGNGNPLQ